MKRGINTFSTQSQSKNFTTILPIPRTNYKKKKSSDNFFKTKIKLNKSGRITPNNRNVVHHRTLVRISFHVHDEDLNKKVDVALSKLRIVILKIRKVLQNLNKLNMDQDL